MHSAHRLQKPIEHKSELLMLCREQLESPDGKTTAQLQNTCPALIMKRPA